MTEQHLLVAYITVNAQSSPPFLSVPVGPDLTLPAQKFSATSEEVIAFRESSDRAIVAGLVEPLLSPVLLAPGLFQRPLLTAFAPELIAQARDQMQSCEGINSSRLTAMFKLLKYQINTTPLKRDRRD